MSASYNIFPLLLDTFILLMKENEQTAYVESLPQSVSTNTVQVTRISVVRRTKSIDQ